MNNALVIVIIVLSFFIQMKIHSLLLTAVIMNNFT